MLGSTHGGSNIIKFGGSTLGNSLGAEVGAEVVTERGSTDGFSGGNGDGKIEVYLMGETLGS